MKLIKETIQRPADRPTPTTRYLMHLLLALHLLLIFCTGATTACAAPVSSPSNEVRLWTAPLLARPGEMMEIVAVAIDGELTDLYATDPAGRQSKLTTVPGGGPPWSLRGKIPAAARGSYRIEARRGNKVVAATEITVGGGAAQRGSGEWDLASQALYAAWVEHLFDSPPEISLSFPSQEPVLRDPQRNFLYDYLN